MTDRFDAGMKVRREVLGDAHVERAEAAKSSFDVTTTWRSSCLPRHRVTSKPV